MSKISATSYRVMIVDDEPILRTGILHLCNWAQHNIEIVAQASNGQEALACIDQAQPHVVITDIVMPVMDGVEFTRILRQQYPNIKVIVLSSYSEFDYVREVFKYGVNDYLLKPKVAAPELISLIQSLCSEIIPSPIDTKSKKPDIALVLAEVLQNSCEDTNDAWQNLQSIFRKKHFRILQASTSLLLTRTDWTQAQVEQQCIGLTRQHLHVYQPVCMFLKNECVVLLHYDGDEKEHVPSAILEFTREAMKSLTYVKFIVSREFNHMEQIPKEHQLCTSYLGKLIYFPNRYEVQACEIHSESTKVHFDQAAFTSLLRSWSIDEAQAELQSLFSLIRSTQAYDEYSLKRLAQNIIYSAMSTLEEMKQPLSDLTASKLQLFKQIDLAFDWDELHSIFILFLDDLKRVIRKTDPQTMIVHRIYEYVNQNYANEISLSELAEQFHLNYSYLSSYFKQRTNENITTYINRVRTDKAKELLRSYEASISQISQMTGYSDHNYFSKVFKKMTGMTPVEYRNQNAKDR
ncbi:two-component system response regulator YesN [Paenibacillus shirakamiensis]|uniref:Two-component system response regulator YesN n=1 Tax=Paenibacillus shirakamiensis TaxID=1265935 RepID=A0ABS4JEH1_9BACL|nr:response regulator [Paenibacillus shirakamiensis]MBP2000112.1 two-component system response regulator YesN [Paenibacillus shirakamiensis]